ncbi:hypothetical protein [Microbacterium lacticum]
MTTQSPPTSIERAAPPPRHSRVGAHVRRALRSWQLYVLLAPAVLYIVIFKYWPMYGAQIAFRDYNPALGFSGSPWVGLDHFIRFVNSFQFWRLIENTLTLNALGLLIAFPVPIILALVVNQLQSERFKKFTQTVLYSPSFISVVVVAGMIFLLFSPRSGIVNNAIVAFGGDPGQPLDDHDRAASGPHARTTTRTTRASPWSLPSSSPHSYACASTTTESAQRPPTRTEHPPRPARRGGHASRR